MSGEDSQKPTESEDQTAHKEEESPGSKQDADESAVSGQSDDLDAVIGAAADLETPKIPEEPSPEQAEAVAESAQDLSLSDTQQPEPDAVAAEEREGSESGIDQLLTDPNVDVPLNGLDLDAVIGSEGGAEDVLGGSKVASSGVADAVSEPSDQAASVAESEEEKEDVETEGRAEVIGPSEEEDEVVAAAAESVSTENLAAAAPAGEAEDGLLAQGVLDTILKESEEAEGKPAEEQPVAPEAPAAPQAAPEEPPPAEEEAAPPAEGAQEEPPPTSEPREPIAFVRLLRANMARAIVSVAAGILCAVGTFAFLYTHRARLPGPDILSQYLLTDLEQAMRSAEEFIDAGDYQEAFDELGRALAAAPADAERADAQLLQLEAAYKGLTGWASDEDIEAVHMMINEFVVGAGSYPGVSEALYWQAKLYERQGAPYAARDSYSQILTLFPDTPILDETLFDAARLALQVDRADDAGDYLRRLLQEFPGSPLAGQAKVALGDVYVAVGEQDAARNLYTQIARSQPDTRLGAEAVARLGQLSFGQGAYDEAIKQLETRLEMATTIEGNDRIYLLLGRAYRAKGELGEAERVLRELVDFFPETEVMPLAYAELAQVLEEGGFGPEARRLVAHAVQRYDDNPEVLTVAGEIMRRAGDHRAAGRLFLAAHEAGPGRPEALLDAARSFGAAQAVEEALRAYERLTIQFPTAPHAFEGRIEMAEVLYRGGKVRKALEGLEDLALASEGRPERLPVLVVLGEIYRDMGLRERAGAVFSQVAVLSAEPEMLAKAATTMLEAGAWDQGLAVANRVPVSALPDKDAYALLLEHGKALLQADPTQALGKLRQAYESYPGARTPGGDQLLLETYLARGAAAHGRALVMELEAQARRDPVHIPRLQQAAVTWGDYLYDRGDYAAAVEAYALAADAVAGSGDWADWAAYQRANALFEMGKFNESVAFYDTIAASGSPWAEEAGIRAAYVRIEQRLRGVTVPGPDGQR